MHLHVTETLEESFIHTNKSKIQGPEVLGQNNARCGCRYVHGASTGQPQTVRSTVGEEKNILGVQRDVSRGVIRKLRTTGNQSSQGSWRAEVTVKAVFTQPWSSTSCHRGFAISTDYLYYY